MPTTSDLRRWWAPHCTGPWTRLELYGTGVITVRSACAPAFRRLDSIMQKWDYKTERHHTGAYNCRQITGGTNWSLHAYGIAADYNWQRNPYGPTLITDMPMGMVEEIEALRTNSGQRVFRWGGRYSRNKDAMHYEIFCSPADLATGIKSSGTTDPVTPQPPQPDLPNEEEEEMYLIRNNDAGSPQYGAVYAVSGLFRQPVTAADYGRWQFITGGPDNIRQLDAGAFDFFMRNFVEVQNINFAALYSRVAANGVADVSEQVAGIAGAAGAIDADALVDAVVERALDDMAARLAE